MSNQFNQFNGMPEEFRKPASEALQVTNREITKAIHEGTSKTVAVTVVNGVIMGCYELKDGNPTPLTDWSYEFRF